MSRILVVEDERHLADGLRYNLEADEHEVDLADTGEEALRLLAEQPRRYDLVVLDVMLPGIDGFAVTVELRRLGQYVPVLILTARGRSEDVLMFVGAAGAFYSLTRYEQDRKSQSRTNRARAAMFGKKSFTRDGVKYVRHMTTRNGKKYYYFARA